MKICSFFLVATLLLTSRHAVTQDKLSSPKPLPVLAWYSIPAEETTIPRYQELKDAGFNYSYTAFRDLQALDSALVIAKKTGIRIIASCPELRTRPVETVRHLMGHPALAGYYLQDEPAPGDFPGLGALVREISAIDTNHFCYLNLLPTYADMRQLGVKDYDEYVKEFIRQVPIQLLSFDHYPVVGDSLRPDWYENLDIFSRNAREAGKPFWAFALAVAHGPYPIPTVAELRLQVYSNLAYGAQGIQYFTYWTPEGTPWDFHRGPITIGGKRTEVYDRVRLVNAELRRLSGVFVGATVRWVAHTGQHLPRGAHRLPPLPPEIIRLDTRGQGAVVSLLDNGLFAYLVVVNRDFRRPMELSLKVRDGVEKVLKDGTLAAAGAYSEMIPVGPGDVAIYRWKKY